MNFFENKIDWHLVYELDAYSLFNTVNRWICVKNFLIIDNEVH